MTSQIQHPFRHNPDALRAARMTLLEGIVARKLPAVFDAAYCRDVRASTRHLERLLPKIRGIQFDLGHVDDWFAMMRIRGVAQGAIMTFKSVTDPRMAELIDSYIEVALRVQPDFLHRFVEPAPQVDEDNIKTSELSS